MTDPLFASWVSGFADGESTFNLHVSKSPKTMRPHVSCRFYLTLREDDLPILERVKEHFGCGSLSHVPRVGGASKPQWRYGITTLRDNLSSLIPHFDAYPLRSKKANDYILYRRAVMIQADAFQRPRTQIAGKLWSKWTTSDYEAFLQLKRDMENGRAYRPSRK